MPKYYVLRVNMTNNTVAGTHIVHNPNRLIVNEDEELVIYETKQEFIDAINQYEDIGEIVVVEGTGHTDPQVGAPNG